MRILNDNTYRPLFIVCNYIYIVGQKYSRNPSWAGPFVAFRTQADAENYAKDMLEWAIFECDGIESNDKEMYWAVPNYIYRNQGVEHYGGQLIEPKGMVYLEQFRLLRKVAERKI